MPRIPGELFARLREAIVMAFTTEGLGQLWRIHMEADLESVVNTNKPSGEVAFEVINWVERQGQWGRFLNALSSANRNNQALREAVEAVRQHLGGPASPPPPPPPVPVSAGLTALDFVEAMGRLLSGEFETVVTALGIDRAKLGGPDQLSKANDVYRLAQRGDQLGQLEQLLRGYNVLRTRPGS